MKTIYLEPNEEIISVIDRLNQTKVKEVSLVVPAGAQIWQNSINLKLLKRESDNLDKEITLIVSDDLEAESAQKIGFLVKKEESFPTGLIREEEKEDKEDMIGLLVEELRPKKEKKRSFGWPRRSKKQRKKMIDIVSPSGRSEIIQPSAKETNPIFKESELRKPREVETAAVSKWPKFFIIFIGLTLLVAAIVGYLALPTTKIVISPKTEKVNFDLVVIGSEDISHLDESLNKIPLQELRIEKTKSKRFMASGEKQLNERARGMITIYNEYSSSPQTLVATTRFESPEGKTFRITEKVVVPGAKIEEGRIVPSTLKAEVVADQPGADYNIGPTNFTIPGFKGTAKYAGFYAKSEASMTGGSTEKIKIVLASDLKEAKENLTEELKNEVKETLQGQIPADFKLVEGGIKEEITEISAVEEGSQADDFTIEMKAVARALLFKEEDLKKIVDLNLISNISEKKRPLSETQQIKRYEPTIDWSAKEVAFSLGIEEEVAWRMDIQALKEDLAGQTETEVRKYLAGRPEIKTAKVTFWPFWVKRIPIQKKKIKITID